MKKLISILLTCVIVLSVIAASPSTEASAKKKKKTKAKTTVTLTEEASCFTRDTWKPTYSDWTEKQIEKASDRGTGKNIFDKYGKIIDLPLAKDKEFVTVCATIKDTTSEGHYGYVEDRDDALVSYLQKKIRTVSDLWLYLTLTGYSYLEDDQGFMSSPNQGWNMQNDARINILDNCGVCCETAMIANYMLEGDYEETGFVTVHSSFGHQYIYVKDKGVYYFVDFTDYTSAKEMVGCTTEILRMTLDGDRRDWDHWKEQTKEFEDKYDTWKNKICFWSGSSLDDPSATKAALIHDTYEKNNNREELSWDWAEDNSGFIWAQRYYAGSNGSAVSWLMDCANRGKDDLKYNLTWEDEKGKRTTYRLEYLGVSLPEYTWYQVLYIDKGGRVFGSPFKELAPVELRLVPWFCDLSPEAQKIVDSTETYMQKMLRQTNFGTEGRFKITLGDGSQNELAPAYTYHYSPFNREIRIAAFLAYDNLLNRYGMNRGRISLENLLAKLDMDFYGVGLIKSR